MTARALLDRVLRRRVAGAAVEFALLLPVVLALIVGLIETGRLIWTWNVLEYAAQEGARCAVVDANRCGTTAQIQAYAAGRAPGLSLPASAVSVDAAACGTRIRIVLPFTSVAVGLVPYDLTLSSEACYPN